MRRIKKSAPDAHGLRHGCFSRADSERIDASKPVHHDWRIEAATQGVFDLTKEPSLAITAGARVFWDHTNRRVTPTATGNFSIGIATAAALAADATVRVWLNRVPASGA